MFNLERRVGEFSDFGFPCGIYGEHLSIEGREKLVRDFYDAAFPCRVVLTRLTNAEIQSYTHISNETEKLELEEDQATGSYRVSAGNIDDVDQCM